MCHPARSNSAMVASCRLPLGMPSFSLLAMLGLRLRCPGQRDGLRKAANCPLVADQPVAFDDYPKHDCILVAVGSSGHDAQPVSAGLSFHPQLLSRAAPKCHKACLQRLGIACLIEKAHHQYLSGLSILHD